MFATVRDTPRSLENQRSQCAKAVRLAREAHRLAPSVVGSRAVRELEDRLWDLERAWASSPLRVAAVDIS